MGGSGLQPSGLWVGVGVGQAGQELPLTKSAESQKILITPQGEDALAISFLEMRKRRLEELVGLAQGHMARNG